jgi:hypothetical protein
MGLSNRLRVHEYAVRHGELLLPLTLASAMFSHAWHLAVRNIAPGIDSCWDGTRIT